MNIVEAALIMADAMMSLHSSEVFVRIGRFRIY
jgi:hypothetical protein